MSGRAVPSWSIVEASTTSLMDRLMPMQLTDQEVHCTCMSRHPIHAKNGICGCLLNADGTTSDCGCRSQRSVEQYVQWCLQTTPYIARFYANAGRILFRSTEKTALRLPTECLSYSMYGQYVNVIELGCISLSIDRNTAAAYALLHDFVKLKDRNGVIYVPPDGRCMTVADLSNESLSVGHGASPPLASDIGSRTDVSQQKKGEVSAVSYNSSGISKGNDGSRHVQATLSSVWGSRGASSKKSIPLKLTVFLNQLKEVVVFDNVKWISAPIIESAESLDLTVRSSASQGSCLGSVRQDLRDVEEVILSSMKGPSPKLLEALNACDLIIRQKSDSEGAIAARSRAFILSAMIYFLVDAPEGAHVAPSGRPTNLDPEAAGSFMTNQVPDYLDDGRGALIQYLSALEEGRCAFDLLFPLALAMLLRFESKLGAIKMRNKVAPYAASWQLLQLLVSLTDVTKKTENLDSWDKFVLNELSWYSCIDTQYFLIKIPQESSREEASRGKGSIVVESVQQKIRVTRGSFASDAWEAEVAHDRKFSASVPTMAKLLSFTGLEKVKMAVIDLYRRIWLAHVRGAVGDDVPLNFRFVGNPGTGKTEVARMVSQILAELNVRPGVTEADKTSEADASAAAAKAAAASQMEDLKEKAEQLALRRYELEASSAQERYDSLSSQLSTARVMTQAASTIGNGVQSTHRAAVDASIKAVSDTEQTLQAKLQQANHILQKAVAERDAQNKKLAEQRAAAAAAKSTATAASSTASAAVVVKRLVETYGGELANKGPDHFNGLVQSLLDADPPGGVIFIDEAHQLISSSSPRGKDVVQALVKHSEDHRAVLSFILAGYAKDMEKLVDADPGLASRFPHQNLFVFDDFSADELTEILHGMLKKIPVPFGKPDWHFEDDSLADVVGRRIARGRGKKGFANARAVRSTLHGAIMERNASRVNEISRRNGPGTTLSDHELFCLTKSDVLGQEPDPLLSKAFISLNKMVGLDSVKADIADLMRVLRSVWDADLSGEPCNFPQLNRVFAGPPGTGKTTVAEIYGRILRESGFIADGEVVKKLPADFLGGALGESEVKTKMILESCRGKVLLIDEAYGLGRDTEFHKAVLDTIVGEVPSEGGGDMVVILVGYEDSIDEMLRKGNPGLTRRFSHKIRFEPYNRDELRRILKSYAISNRINMPFNVAEAAADALAKQRKLRNFGNAGAALNLLDSIRSQADRRIQEAVAAGRLKAPRPGDNMQVLVEDVTAVTESPDPFEGLIIPDELQKYIDSLTNELEFARALKRRPPPIKHVVFVGPPGTGKTTAARAMAKLLHKAGVLPTSNLVEKSGETIVAGFVGQTQIAVTEFLREAQGGVLFIDEAHRLASTGGRSGANSFKEEAMGVLIGAMTSPEYQDNLLIVFAGYTEPIDSMLKTDQGLKRRIGARVEFNDITLTEAENLLHSKLKDENAQLDSSCHGEPVQNIFKELKSRPGWGNIGDVERLAQLLFSAASTRLLRAARALGDEDEGNILLASWDHIYTRDDLDVAGQQFIESRPLFQEKIAEVEDSIYAAATDFKQQQAQRLVHNMLAKTTSEEPTHDCTKEEHDKDPCCQGSSSHRRLILDTLNDIYQSRYSGDYSEYIKMMSEGSTGPGWSTAKEAAAAALKDQSIENLEAEIEQAMEDTKAALENGAARAAEYQRATDELDRLTLLLRDASNASDADKVAELERLKAAEEARLKALVRICGVCGRGDNPYSGCGYRGSSPLPIFITVGELPKFG